jgi:putative membrane protein
MSDAPAAAAGPPSDPRVELASRRTGMAFQRTRMAADRTLMAVIRTALSLIGFGFTIAKTFRQLHEAGIVTRSESATNFGATLVGVGIAMLLAGIGYHIAFMVGLRRTRADLKAQGIIHAESQFPASLTLMVAVALLAIGIFAILSLLFRIGPFG